MVDDVEFKKAQEHMLKGAEKGENFLKHFTTLMKSTTGRTSDVLRSSAMEQIKKEKFDLIVFGLFVNDFQIGLAHHFDCPSVIISVMPAANLIRKYVGNPDELSSVPQLFIAGSDRMTFTQRFLSAIFTGIEMVFSGGLEYFVMEPIYREHFPPETFPSYWEMKKNVSLVLVNQHFTQGTPQALVPALQEFSGMHIKRKPDPLPEVQIANLKKVCFQFRNFPFHRISKNGWTVQQTEQFYSAWDRIRKAPIWHSINVKPFYVHSPN